VRLATELIGVALETGEPKRSVEGYEHRGGFDRTRATLDGA
jgi:hypothetical protein